MFNKVLDKYRNVNWTTKVQKTRHYKKIFPLKLGNYARVDNISIYLSFKYMFVWQKNMVCMCKYVYSLALT